ncbi:2-phospho-L-lactate transferase [Methanoculleus sp. FWC-SCC1]|uniref:2-phospho-L-lactate transferase n=1 Tax=Methanoculleus frigidifontis TaxID=2584085 RepID=A0ABT8MDY3_9EURY|nr:2-phospho-L-lactate transferase CofD family protein [Methanoculleus sp. FWC-SCC1]MDN7026114.1 2-phospho-L-lactate transferase [Methanoculleus sp. FWC-SCC1]
MITFLSGGAGTPRLVQSVRQILYDGEIAVVANTADDLWISGGYHAPDLETLLYLFAGILNTGTWQGIGGDTFSTHRYLKRAAGEEWLEIGDKERAVQIARGEMLRSGVTATEAARRQASAFGIEATILPMTDTGITTFVETGEGAMHILEYCRAAPADPAIRRILRAGEEEPAATPEVLGAIAAADAVIIGPSHPVQGILPILDCAGVRETLDGQLVIAVSPFRADKPVSPVDTALMRAAGVEPTASGVYSLYQDVADIFVQDLRDPDVVEGALRLDTRLWRGRNLDALAWDLMAVIRKAVS